MAQRVAGLPDPQDNVTQGAEVGELPEARETAHLKGDILRQNILGKYLPVGWSARSQTDSSSRRTSSRQS